MSDLNPFNLGPSHAGRASWASMQKMHVTMVQLFMADGTGAPDQTSALHLTMAGL
jgi:hypothetical protein